MPIKLVMGAMFTTRCSRHAQRNTMSLIRRSERSVRSDADGRAPIGPIKNTTCR